MREELNQKVPINGERLRAWRNIANLTQVGLAKKSGVSRSYIAEIENGRKHPSFLVADALAVALDVEVDDLVLAKSRAS